MGADIGAKKAFPFPSFPRHQRPQGGTPAATSPLSKLAQMFATSGPFPFPFPSGQTLAYLALYGQHNE